jgi:hypothetical protein
MMTCDYCSQEFEPRRSGGSPERFCPGGLCRKAFHAEARRVGAKTLQRRNGRRPDFGEERLKPEFRREVAEILAWAEAQHPATPEAWGLTVTVGGETMEPVIMKAGDEEQVLHYY